jgi:RNA polymerase sigma factor (sigma-70 family)
MTGPSEADSLLIQRIRQGESDAWSDLISRYEGRLLAFVESRLKHRGASEDIVQEAFIGFLNSLPNYDGKRPLESYLFSIAAHKLTDYLRREGRRPATDLRESRLRQYETRWRERLGAEIRIGLAFRLLASRLNDRGVDSLIELARIDGLIPMLRQTADFNWHRQSALALLRHSQFRRILLSSLWS